MSKTSIPDPVKQLLFGMAAGRCEYQGCNKLLTRDDLGQRGKFSVFAHIIADEPGGPRGDAELSPKLAQEITNLMLLCLEHHRLIDVDDVAGHSVERLHKMKARHEERVRRLTEIDDNHRTQLVLMAANIGERKGVVSAQDACRVVLPMYAANDAITIELAHLRVVDGDRVAWDVGQSEVDAVACRLQEQLARESAPHLSIFALAPIPLLMYLGRKLGDIAPGEVYQRRRSPEGWSWLPETGEEPAFEVPEVEVGQSCRDVAIVCSVSDEVDIEKVLSAGPSRVCYVLRVPQPTPDLVRAREQVGKFRAAVRELLRRIRERHGAGVTAHVFPALPNSLAVEFGRVLLPKTDPHMVVYDFNRASGGWNQALTLLSPIVNEGVRRARETSCHARQRAEPGELAMPVSPFEVLPPADAVAGPQDAAPPAQP